jgi:hypothetical protein
MIEAILWFLAVGLTAVPLWILWRAGKKAASLDFRLSQNDASLLEDDGVIITQMTGLPPNTRIVPNANVVVEQTSQTNGAMPETLA